VKIRNYLIPVIFLVFPGCTILALEEAKYELLLKDGEVELRRYEPHLLAETKVSGSAESAASKAFGRLFRYISGENQTRTKVSMTTPVAQKPAGESISMTAPVSQKQVDDEWVVSFMMPAEFTLETIPLPNDPEVQIRAVPTHQMAVLRYSGRWTSKRYLEHKARLESWLKLKGYTPQGEAVWARFNAPYTPWFMKRNEVQIPVTPPNPSISG